jgi:NADH-quinone oxidoreductase subunit C
MSEDTKTLRERFPEGILEEQVIIDKPALVVRRQGLQELACEAKALGYDYLACITGVDRRGERGEFEVIYNLWSYGKGCHLILKTRCPEDDPSVPSLTAIWKSARWPERETYDLMGIVFEDHPDLKRILLPEPWHGHPLRKDYTMEQEQFVNKGPNGEDVVSFDPQEGW